MSKHVCFPLPTPRSTPEEFPTILMKAGFSPLSSATPDDLPLGVLALLYNTVNSTFTPVIVRSFEDDGTFFYAYQSLCGWANTVLGNNRLEDYLYKVVS